MKAHNGFMRYPILILLLVAGCGEPATSAFPGYAEGEYLRLASPLAGTLAKMHLRKGDTPAAGAPAYVLEQASETAARQESQSRLERAEALLADLRKGARSDEVAAIAADLIDGRCGGAGKRKECQRVSHVRTGANAVSPTPRPSRKAG